MSDQVDDYVKRPLRHENIDGLKELGFGALWIVASLLNVFFETAASVAIWQRVTIFLVCLAALPFIVLYGRKVLRKRITYPRTGYVKYRQTRSWVWRLAGGVLVGLVVASAFESGMRHFAPHSYQTGLIVWTTAIMSLFYIFGTRMDAAWRWVVLVVLIVAPPLVAALPLDHLWSHNLPFMVQGIVFFLSGAIGLALYLRRNPLPQEDAE